MTLTDHPDLFSYTPPPRAPLTAAQKQNRAIVRLRSGKKTHWYIAAARAKALEIYTRTGGKPITVDAVRAELPPPPDVTLTIMGGIFRCPEWVVLDYEPSQRGVNNGRRIARFVRGK